MILTFSLKKNKRKTSSKMSKSASKNYIEKVASTCCRFGALNGLVGAFCHFFTTKMLECLNCIPIIARNSVAIVFYADRVIVILSSSSE